MNSSLRRMTRKPIVPFLALAAAIGLLTARQALALRYAGCVADSACVLYPPGGAACLELYNEGSVGVSSGFEADADWCAYVDQNGPTDGWPCGGALVNESCQCQQ